MGLRSEKRTGVLTVTMDGNKTFVYLRSGVPVFAEEGSHGETLGRLLLRQRLLTQPQYVDVITKMTDALVINEQLRFGELAIELGYLTPDQVEKALKDQVRWKIVRMFQRSEMLWEFEDSEGRLEDVGNYPMSIEALVLDAVRWVDDEQKAEFGLAAVLEQRPSVEVAAADLGARFELSAEEIAFVEKLDGNRTVKQIVSARGQSLDLHALLTSFAMTRAVRFLRDAPSSPRAMPAAEPALPAAERPVALRRAAPAEAAKVPPAPPSSDAEVSALPAVVNRPPAQRPPGLQRPVPSQRAVDADAAELPLVGARPAARPQASPPAPAARPPVTPAAPPARPAVTPATPAASAVRPPSSPDLGPASTRQPTSPNLGPASTRQPTSPNLGPASTRQPTSPNLGPASTRQPTSPNLNPSVRRTTEPDPGAFTGRKPTLPESALGASPPRTRASNILRALEAQKVKSDTSRDPMSEHEAKLLAEQAFQRGVDHVKAARWQQAAPELARASQLLPQSQEYRLYAKWTAIRARTNEPAHPVERAELRRLALASTQADPNFAYGYYVGGEMALLEGDDRQALRYLLRATKLDPSLLDAQRQLRIVERRMGETKKK